jgi:hypothetical protein
MESNKNTGGKAHGLKEIKQYDDGQPQRCLEVSATLQHGGLDSSRQVTSKTHLQERLCEARQMACLNRCTSGRFLRRIAVWSAWISD